MISGEAKSKLERAKTKIEPESRGEFVGIVHQHAAGAHTEVLLDALTQERIDVFALFAYGIAHLHDDLQRRDMPLARYFFVLSELDCNSDEARSLATDLMVYCESDRDVPFARRKELKEAYERAKPYLA